MSRRALWICLAIGSLAGCLQSGQAVTSRADARAALASIHQTEGGQLASTLGKLVRFRSEDSAHASAEDYVLAPTLSRDATVQLACQPAADGVHRVCCNSGGGHWCCMLIGPHAGPRVCI
jgi:hypothetical protein